MRLPPQTEYATYHQRLRYRLDCGREVEVEGCYVSPTTLEVLEGSIEWIRDDVIERLPKRAQKHFRWGEMYGVFVKPVPEGELPVYAIMVQLVCYGVSDPTDHTSRLIVCWLSDDIEKSLPEMIDREICSVEWDKYAADETPYPPATEAGGDYKTVESIDQPDKKTVHPLDSVVSQSRRGEAADETPYPPATEAGWVFKTVESIDQPDKKTVHSLDSVVSQSRRGEAMKMTLNRWLWVAIVVALLYAHLLIGTLVAIATAFYWLLENRQGQPSTSKQSSEEPETFLLKLTTSDAAKNSGWEFWEVFPTLKQMTHERALGDPRTHRERYDYEIRGTNVFVRLLTSSREGCDDTTYDVFNGSINYPQIEAEHQREKERWNGNPIFTLEETIARLQKRIGWHEIYGAIRYFLISKQSNVDEQYDCQRFCKHEYDRITEACSTMEKKAVELGATATFYGYRAPKDASPEIKEAIKQNLSISKFGFHTFGEFEEKEASLKILQEVTR